MIDLSDLEVGDSVKYGSSKCLVCYIKANGAFSYHVVLFNKVSRSQTSYHYGLDGKNQRGGVDIVEIIKNPKRWTDDDMKNAAIKGMEQCCESVFNDWLEQYKANHK